MTRQVLHFGDCRLDIAARELRRGGERVDLPPVVFDCIAYLVAHRQRAIGRDELVAAVWGKTSISDTMLGKAVLAARRAVGDTAEEQKLLRTVPRFGYHWVGAVQEEDAPVRPTAVEATAANVHPPASARWRRHPRFLLLAGGVVLVAIALALALSSWSGPRNGMPPPAAGDAERHAEDTDIPAAAIAVLPGEVLADRADAWLRLGLMDLVATRLREAGLSVISSDNVVRLVPAGTAAPQAIEALRGAVGARRLVAPAIRKSAAEWIVRIELIDDGAQRRAVQASGGDPVGATLAAVDRLLGLLGRRVAATATPAAGELSLLELLQRSDAARLADDLDLARSVITNAPAALRALPEVRMRDVRIDLREGEFARARTQVEELLTQVPAEADPVLHARLLENLCVAQLRLGQVDAALHACDRAIALLETRSEPEALGRAYNSRGIIHARQHRHEAALADFARARVAIDLAGNPLLLAQADANASTVQMVRGRPAEALPIIRRAGATFERFGMINEFATAVVNQIEANLMLLQPLAALKASDEGWSLRERITDPQVRQALQDGRAEALATNGRLAEARVLYDGLIHSDTDDDVQRALTRAALARLDLAGGQAQTALLLARQALPGLPSPEYDRQRARAWLVAVRALYALVRDDEAATEAVAFRAWAGEREMPIVRLYAALAEAERAASAGTHDAAMDAYADATALATRIGSADALAEVASSEGGYLLARGALQQASEVVGRVAALAERDYPTALLQARLYHALGQHDAWEKAMARLRGLAGERPIPERLTLPPGSRTPLAGRS
jgi:DNA-binding winged helix-turn-helix (wHTH) protein/tetratricopeptide (TPR) repeat protein